MRLTKTSIMPYGKYQGKPMSSVPADYLLWLRENKKCSPLVANYIDDNLSDLKKDAEQADRMRDNRRIMRSMYK
ncbi:DUF3820 family protein [uncultured Alistipes sp.]|uniref:putative quorum-sensing-regulated virulence factor n=1 Tax=uncultured Alistipes sp. TaxID=538949 RepID=UPI002622134C|nr:DUF3820 family protein [uncultured Alistipes sp.]